MKLQLKVNCRKKFGLVCQLLAEPAQILFYNSLSVYNSLSAAIQLYMILPLVEVCRRRTIQIGRRQFKRFGMTQIWKQMFAPTLKRSFKLAILWMFLVSLMIQQSINFTLLDIQSKRLSMKIMLDSYKSGKDHLHLSHYMSHRLVFIS